MTNPMGPLGGGRPMLGGTGVGLAGTAARGELYRVVDLTTAGSGSITVTEAGWLELFAWGGGGSGTYAGGANGSGGGGGGGIRRRMPVTAGQTISYSIGAGGAAPALSAPGNAGADTTVTFPDGLLGVARGGSGSASATVGGAGGSYQITGAMTGSTGGAGGSTTAAGSAGADGGGSGGSASGSFGGGGGAAGFGSYTAGLSAGSGGNASSLTASAAGPGGGGGTSGGGGSATPGGVGRLLAYFIRK